MTQIPITQIPLAQIPLAQIPMAQIPMAQIDLPLDDKVSVALHRHPHLAGRNLRFERKEGRITLRGVVSTYFQKQMAQEALKAMDGVDEIRNELEVLPS